MNFIIPLLTVLLSVESFNNLNVGPQTIDRNVAFQKMISAYTFYDDGSV